jgi:hypothetical protein
MNTAHVLEDVSGGTHCLSGARSKCRRDVKALLATLYSSRILVIRWPVGGKLHVTVYHRHTDTEGHLEALGTLLGVGGGVHLDLVFQMGDVEFNEPELRGLA